MLIFKAFGLQIRTNWRLPRCFDRLSNHVTALQDRVVALSYHGSHTRCRVGMVAIIPKINMNFRFSGYFVSQFILTLFSKLTM